MEILITGISGTGKSILCDKLKNYIFKTDKECKIIVDDPSRDQVGLGHGQNQYNIRVRQIPNEEEINKADIVIKIQTQEFANRIKII